MAVVVCLFVLARAFPLGDRFLEFLYWIRTTGYPGMAAFVLIYAAGTVAVVPGTPLTISGGVLFGSVKGVAIVSMGSTLGAALAFLISRYFARESMERCLVGNDHMQRLNRLMERHGAIVVAITRLVPLFPFNLLNYGFGLTRVPFRTYLFWTWLCMLPKTTLLVVGADAFTIGIAEGEIPWRLVGILAIILIVLVFLVRQARKTLDEKEQRP